MEITLTIPDQIAAQFQNGVAKPLSQRIIEKWVIAEYKAERLTHRDIQEILALKDRFQVDDFLKAHEVYLDYSIEDLERDSAALATLLDRQ
jgi:hypothetical protein